MGKPRPDEGQLEEMDCMLALVLIAALGAIGEKLSWEVRFKIGDIPSIVEDRRGV